MSENFFRLRLSVEVQQLWTYKRAQTYRKGSFSPRIPSGARNSIGKIRLVQLTGWVPLSR